MFLCVNLKYPKADMTCDQNSLLLISICLGSLLCLLFCRVVFDF